MKWELVVPFVVLGWGFQKILLVLYNFIFFLSYWKGLITAYWNRFATSPTPPLAPMVPDPLHQWKLSGSLVVIVAPTVVRAEASSLFQLSMGDFLLWLLFMRLSSSHWILTWQPSLQSSAVDGSHNPEMHCPPPRGYQFYPRSSQGSSQFTDGDNWNRRSAINPHTSRFSIYFIWQLCPSNFSWIACVFLSLPYSPRLNCSSPTNVPLDFCLPIQCNLLAGTLLRPLNSPGVSRQHSHVSFRLLPVLADFRASLYRYVRNFQFYDKNYT